MASYERLRLATVGAKREVVDKLRDSAAFSGKAIFVDEMRDFEKVEEFVVRTLPSIIVVGVCNQVSDFDGRVVMRSLRNVSSRVSVLYVVADDLVDHVLRIYEDGVHNIILESDIATEFSRAVSIIGAGGNYISRRIFSVIREPNIRSFYSAINSKLPPEHSAVREPTSDLSEREETVLKLFAFGFSPKEIAAELKISTKTVETYKSRASEKLSLSSRVAIIKYGFANGWFSVLEK